MNFLRSGPRPADAALSPPARSGEYRTLSPGGGFQAELRVPSAFTARLS